MLPYLALALYIISLIASLILMITAKGRQAKGGNGFRWFKIAASIHVVLLLVSCFQLFTSSAQPLAFLFYFCTGTALCGWALRTSIPVIFKVYFFLFNVSLVLFIVMPFQFSVFLLSGSFAKSNEIKFPVNERYYITEQGSVSEPTAHPVYRLVKHRGMFNQTVQYNLKFNGTLDSIHVLRIVNDKSATVRGYFKNAESSTDSTDVEVQLKQQPKNEIKRQI